MNELEELQKELEPLKKFCFECRDRMCKQINELYRVECHPRTGFTESIREDIRDCVKRSNNITNEDEMDK